MGEWWVGGRGGGANTHYWSHYIDHACTLSIANGVLSVANGPDTCTCTYTCIYIHVHD